MRIDPERRLMVDLELLYNSWTQELGMKIRNDIQPTREDERRHLQELKRLIVDHQLKHYESTADIFNELTEDLV